MRIVDIYSFKDGKEVMESRFAAELRELIEIVATVDNEDHNAETRKEKTMVEKALYKPGILNRAFRKEFEARNWKKERIQCEYSTEYYVQGYTPRHSPEGGFREMDFVKNRVGAEVQFKKSGSAVCSVCANMTIFNRYQKVDCGVEIVPVERFQKEMSVETPFFEQFVWDLEHRGIADIDVPVLILGIIGAD